MVRLLHVYRVNSKHAEFNKTMWCEGQAFKTFTGKIITQSSGDYNCLACTLGASRSQTVMSYSNLNAYWFDLTQAVLVQQAHHVKLESHESSRVILLEGLDATWYACDYIRHSAHLICSYISNFHNTFF